VVKARSRAEDVPVTRGEVWWAALDPTIGSKIQRTRPCLVVSPAEINDYLRITLIAPLTTGGRAAPYRIPVTFRGRPGLILLDQLRALDRMQLIRRIGTVTGDTLSSTLAALREMFEE
jgi:mRNA interferase MazF